MRYLRTTQAMIAGTPISGTFIRSPSFSRAVSSGPDHPRVPVRPVLRHRPADVDVVDRIEDAGPVVCVVPSLLVDLKNPEITGPRNCTGVESRLAPNNAESSRNTVRTSGSEAGDN